MRWLLPALLVANSSSGCSTGQAMGPQDTGLDGLALTGVNPGEVIPGSILVIDGRSFVDTEYGTSRLRLLGELDGTPIDLAIPVEFVDYGRLEIAWPGGLAAGLPSDSGRFAGDA